ncbi:uncharacterized protein LOC116775686 [Danaus plexippus]|uniref:uncharacterized protein LOC116775686 n=1 Tax=Danaus plexippus TaxID=13037 RepID=UPI002AB17CA3|nr:uncharacterized protein LOC116775686 [Danaus plexippus]
MTSAVLPVTLTGSNLRSRHREFNLIVNNICTSINCEDVESMPEISSIDRLLKIDIASKQRHVEYILRNLKDDNMLFVSRALKCFWLLGPQYQNIMNPEYLESSLYPDMAQPAVNKMKHWLQTHLKDPQRCELFYIYYKSDFDAAFKFFWHCSNQFILSELSNVIHKLSYAQLNLLVENCPQVGKMYFEILPSNSTALKRYVENEHNYFSCIKYIFKWDGEVFLDIVENYFNTSDFKPFGPSLTNRIMKKYKDRIFDKCELYVSSVLHVNSLAQHFTAEDAKKVVLRLAQAEYLDYWFNYQKVEPLIKRLKKEDRSEFKKHVFVGKSFPKVEKWPYPIPAPPKLNDEHNLEIFKDISDEPYMFELRENCDLGFRRFIKKKSCRYSLACMESCMDSCMPVKTQLDRLFNRYRLDGFEKTFYELSKNLKAESSGERRLDMMLVLVSKSGGVPDQVGKLMKLLVEKYKNEPTTLRAAVIRSLTKRCCAWRLPEDIWTLILEFGRDVGLDGADSSPLCREGLHAVIIRHLLADTPISSTLVSGFMREFSKLSEYKLDTEERKVIAHRLPSLVLPLNQSAFLDCLSEYNIDIKQFPEAKKVILDAAKEDTNLLLRLYNSKIFRRELFREVFCLRQSEEDYLNVLRHDVTPLEDGVKFATLVTKERPKHDRFLRLLNVYFGEADGLAEKHRKALEEAFSQQPHPRFARPLCTVMSGQALISYLCTLDTIERPLGLEQFQSLHEFRANAHKTKDSLDIKSIDWKWIGAKAVYNKVSICRSKEKDQYIEKLLRWKRTARIALRLSMNTPSHINILKAVCKLRPSVVLKVALSTYLKQNVVNIAVWDVVKSVIFKLDLNKNKRLLTKMVELGSLPENVEADYWTCVYRVLDRTQKKKAMPILCRLNNMFHKVDSSFFYKIIKEYIEKDFNIFEEEEHNETVKKLYIKIIAKYLVLHPEESSKENICESFFNILNKVEDKDKVLDHVNIFIFDLKYSKAFMEKEYSTSMKVFEEILRRLHAIFPTDQYFSIYADLHLTMLYFKAINQTMKNDKEVFNDANKAIEVVGHLFGKYVGCEIKELVSRYFWSVIDLYSQRLVEYLRSYFEYNEGRSRLVTFVIKGILDVGTVESLILAEQITRREINYNIQEPHRADILDVLKQSDNPEIKFFLYADILC